MANGQYADLVVQDELVVGIPKWISLEFMVPGC